MICYKLALRQDKKIYSYTTAGKYKLLYKVGKETEMAEDSVGLFCFKTLKTAKIWNKRMSAIILKVEGISRIKRPKTVAKFGDDAKKFYSGNPYVSLEQRIDKNWIFFKKVKVIKIIEK